MDVRRVVMQALELRRRLAPLTNSELEKLVIGENGLHSNNGGVGIPRRFSYQVEAG